MKQQIKDLIRDVKKQGHSSTLGREDPEQTVNAWWVVARLQEILLEGK